MKNLNLLVFITIACFFLSFNVFSQDDGNNYLVSKWVDYYEKNPSGVRQNFTASDFIRIIEVVDFVPTHQKIRGNTNALKELFLRLSYKALRQCSIHGYVAARSIKHDDYYQLYNIYYNKIEKHTWDTYAPYLIVLMDVDGVINFR